MKYLLTVAQRMNPGSGFDYSKRRAPDGRPNPLVAQGSIIFDKLPFLLVAYFIMLPLRAEQMVQASDLSVGIAVIDVTPPVGYRMSGYFNERLSTGVMNPLHAKAIVWQQNDVCAALVFCDMIGISPDVSKRAREQASAKTGIPVANILVAATHSHTGPLYCGALRNHFHALAVAKHGHDPQETEDYPSKLVAQLVQVIVKAQAAIQPVQIVTGKTLQHGLSFNRRYHMKDGSVRFNPGVLNPDIVRPAGPIDPDVSIILVRDVSGDRAVAGLINFALHLDTIGGTLYAADYPFYTEQYLRQSLGQDFVLLFGNGTCGDINHIDVTSKDRLTTEVIGTSLGKTVQNAIPELRTVTKPSLAARSAIVRVPLQQFSPQQIEQARLDILKVGSEEMPFLQQVEACKILAIDWRGGTTIPLEVQVFRLGDELAIVGLPGEVFVDLGLAIKEVSPFETTLVIELCNDEPGYIPTQKAFTEGSYETVNSRIIRGGGEQLVDAAERLLKELKE